MHHHVLARQHLQPVLALADISLHHRDVGGQRCQQRGIFRVIAMDLGRKIIQDSNLVATLDKRACQCTANETRTTGDQNFHVYLRSLSKCVAVLHTAAAVTSLSARALARALSRAPFIGSTCTRSSHSCSSRLPDAQPH
jgi:hypothetical protein